MAAWPHHQYEVGEALNGDVHDKALSGLGPES